MSVPSTMRSYPRNRSTALVVSSRTGCRRTSTVSLMPAMVSRALSPLRPADVGLAVDDLALQIGAVDLVELDDADRADPGRGEIQQRRGGAESARADEQHLRVPEPFLPGDPPRPE